MTYSFSTISVQPEHRFEAFKDAVERSYVPSVFSEVDLNTFQADLNMRSFGAVNLSEIWTTKLLADVERSARQVSAPDVLFLQIVMQGETRITQGEAAIVTRVGEMSLLDTTRPYSVRVDEGSKHLVLEIPRSELESRVGNLTRVTDRLHSTRSLEGKLAVDFLGTLYGSGVKPTDAATGALARQAIDVAALALTHGDVATVRRLSSPSSVSRLRLHHAVEQSLTDGITHCDDVAGMAGISARYANILLRQEGTTLERLLVQRRLERCLATLQDLRSVHVPIAEIAMRWGFVSASHFARAFRDAYGMTARECRQRAVRAASADHLSRRLGELY